MAIGIIGQIASWVANAAFRTTIVLKIVDNYNRRVTAQVDCPAVAFQSTMIGFQLLMLVVTTVLVVVRVERRNGLSRIIVALGSVGMVLFAIGQIIGTLLAVGGCPIDQPLWSKIVGCIGGVLIIVSAFLYVLAPESRKPKKLDDQLVPQGVVYASA
ncbi:hypothetical protein FOL47_004520 [Perkinsus chesapeaki]|uniref:Uncharacterized protein n=1 Tax=Perkinsus chesapeaki TaxID=330153 RepID=A0A7J6M1Y7_PERCH|nr:hypothetical protein FOL47_004520 [Perkinsus chesapeaki]